MGFKIGISGSTGLANARIVLTLRMSDGNDLDLDMKMRSIWFFATPLGLPPIPTANRSFQNSPHIRPTMSYFKFLQTGIYF
jgi:hypothetical protein